MDCVVARTRRKAQKESSRWKKKKELIVGKINIDNKQLFDGNFFEFL